MTKWYLNIKLCQVKRFDFLGLNLAMGRKKQSKFKLLCLSHKKCGVRYTPFDDGIIGIIDSQKRSMV